MNSVPNPEGVNLEEANFQIAFGLRNRHTNEYFEEDSSVWGWLPTMIEKGPERMQKNRLIQVHKCKGKDWEKFPPVAKVHELQFNDLKKSGVMYCLNEKDTAGRKYRSDNLFGDLESDYRTLKISAFFCQPKGIDKVWNSYQENIAWQ